MWLETLESIHTSNEKIFEELTPELWRKSDCEELMGLLTRGDGKDNCINSQSTCLNRFNFCIIDFNKTTHCYTYHNNYSTIECFLCIVSFKNIKEL